MVVWPLCSYPISSAKKVLEYVATLLATFYNYIYRIRFVMSIKHIQFNSCTIKHNWTLSTFPILCPYFYGTYKILLYEDPTFFSLFQSDVKGPTTMGYSHEWNSLCLSSLPPPLFSVRLYSMCII